MFNNFVHNKECEYKKYLKNKKVIVVGPAPYLINKNYGEKIDNYDLVVRFNRSFPVKENLYKDYGAKTDILYHCMSERPQDAGIIDKNKIVEQNVWLCSPFPLVQPFSFDIVNFNNNNKLKNLKFYYLKEIELFMEIQHLLQSRPNTGLMGLIDLLNSDIASIDIIGMTFFKGKVGEPQYIKEYRDINYQQLIENTEFGTHRQQPQINLFKKMLAHFSNISIDDELQKVLREY